MQDELAEEQNAADDEKPWTIYWVHFKGTLAPYYAKGALAPLDILPENGDMNVSGEITSYDTKPMAVTADEVASQNRLTVTVKIYFTNRLHPEEDFEKSFSAYADYDSNQLLDAVESSLCDEIIDILVEDIFNATVANW